MVKNPPASAGDPRLIPGSGRSPGEGNGNPLQCSCLKNPMDRGAGRITILGVAESDTNEHAHRRMSKETSGNSSKLGDSRRTRSTSSKMSRLKRTGGCNQLQCRMIPGWILDVMGVALKSVHGPIANIGIRIVEQVTVFYQCEIS